MDLTKLLKLATDHLSEYFWVFIATLRNPVLRFQPLAVFGDTQKEIALLSKPQTGSRLNPKLLSFVIISIFVGSIINSFIPTIQTGSDFATTFIIVLAYWFFCSCITHGLCKLLKGQGTFTDTLSISLQVTSVLYVVSSFITLLVSVAIATFQPSFSFVSSPRSFACSGTSVQYIVNPESFYFLIHFILLSVYLPIALKRVHGFGQWQLITIIILTLLISRIPQYLLSTAIYSSTNILAPGGGC